MAVFWTYELELNGKWSLPYYLMGDYQRALGKAGLLSWSGKTYFEANY